MPKCQPTVHQSFSLQSTHPTVRFRYAPCPLFLLTFTQTHAMLQPRLTILALLLPVLVHAQDTTYAARLGYPKGARALLIHVDAAGMSYESNQGAIVALSDGAAPSVSVMMPCPWVPGFVKWLHEHPTIDAGLHLTLTSEWDEYR